MIKKIILRTVAVIVVGVVIALAYTLYHKSPELFEPSVVGLYQEELPALDPTSARTIDSGDLVGVSDAYNTQAWVGIPYAAAPTGDLRWKAPRPAVPWTGALEANDYGTPCSQYMGLAAGLAGEDGEVVGNEDCLTLNVWAPAQEIVDAEEYEKHPVMVWIHGGSNDSGTANMYQGHHLSGSKKVVVVGVNYRLGLLGWLSHDAIRATAETPEDASGNFGTLDLIEALKWVQTNIDQFGGNPENVTIFGESAGGRNVYSLLASPLAKDLFHKAIVQSGTPDTTKLSLAENFADDKATSNDAGLINSSNELFSAVLRKAYPAEDQATIRARLTSTPSDELMALFRSYTPTELMNVASENLGREGEQETADVLRDGYVLPKESTMSLFQDPSRYNSVPLMTGTNLDENKLFMFRNPDNVEMMFGVIPVIRDEKRYNRISKLVSDNWKAGAVDEPAIAITATEQPVYAYRFEWDDFPPNLLADLSVLIGATHAFEISYVFGDFTGGTPTEIAEGRLNLERRRDLSLSMMDYWAEFAYSGKPGKGRSGTQPEWSEWSDAGDNLMILDESSSGGIRMSEIRHRFADVKQALKTDDVLTSLEEKCRGYADLFMHGYQTDDFFDQKEYESWGCVDYPAAMFRTD